MGKYIKKKVTKIVAKGKQKVAAANKTKTQTKPIDNTPLLAETCKCTAVSEDAQQRYQNKQNV